MTAGEPAGAAQRPRAGGLGVTVPGPPARGTLANIAAAAASMAVERGAQVILVVVATWALGLEVFGRYAFAAGVSAVLAFGVDLGLTLWTTRALAREPARAPELLGTGLALRLLATPPYLLCVGAVAVAVGPGETRIAMLALGGAALARAYLDHARAVFRAHERLSDEARVNGATALAAAAAGIGALGASRGGLTALALGVMAGTWAGAVFGFALLRRRYGRVAGPAKRTLAARMLRESLPFWLAGLATLVYTRVDVVLLRAFAGDAEVGTFRAAGQVFEVVKQLPTLALLAVFPRLARADPPAKLRLERLTSVGLLAAGAGACLALAAAADPLTRLLFPPEFARTSSVLQLLALGVPLIFLNCGLLHFLAARDLGVLNLTLSGLMVPVNLGANLALAPRLGAAGSAAATVITEIALAAGCLLALRTARRRRS
jgi:O-antigen/teichoic acid export membrane protein